MDSRKILLNSCLQTTDSLKIQKNPSKYLLNSPHMHQLWNSAAEQWRALGCGFTSRNKTILWSVRERLQHSTAIGRCWQVKSSETFFIICVSWCTNQEHASSLFSSLTHMDNRFASEFELRYYSELFKTYAFKWLSTASSFRSVPRTRQRKHQPGWHTRWCDDCMKMGFP